MTQPTILLVEDNPDDVLLTRRAFQRQNLANDLLVVESGEEALAWLFQEDAEGPNPRRTLPSVVLLDLKLPGIDGIEVLRRIRADARTSSLPVVIMTSSRAERDVVAGYASGANSYIQKPLDFDQFVESVKILGLYWLLLNVPPIGKD